MRAFSQFALLCGVVLLSGQNVTLQASPREPGPCAARLRSLGYKRVELDATRASSSLYEARRGAEEVKLMVDNGSCMIRQIWLDD